MTTVPFKYLPPGPAAHGAAVSPSNSTVLEPTRMLWVGGAGDLHVIMAGQTTETVLVAVAAGTQLPLTVTKVLAATSATGIVAFW